MTRMLASVTGSEEALLVMDAQVDLVDLKDPVAGALAALPADVVAGAVATVAGRVPVSATAGDLVPVRRQVISAVRRICDTGVDYVKIGMLDPARWAPLLRGLREALPAEARLIGVVFADQPHDFSLIEALATAGFAGVMLDTVDKRGAGLRRHVDDRQLHEFVSRARGAGLLTGLAGSLGVDDIEALLVMAPDYLGFRGALCRRGARGDRLDPAAMQAVRARFPAPLRAAPWAGSSWRSGSPEVPSPPARR